MQGCVDEKLTVLEMGMSNPIGLVCLCVLTSTTLLSIGTADAADECTAIKLDFGQKSVPWGHLPLSKLKRDTVYTLRDDDGRKILHAEADGSASFYGTRFEPPVALPTTIEWRWKTDALIPGADNRDKSREDSPLRLIVAFDGDAKTLPDAEQRRLRRAKLLSGRAPPFATLIYLWSDQVPVNTVIPSAHTSQVKMLVAASGKSGLGAWQAVRRNLVEDYRRAYASHAGRVIAVGVMTDTDNTGAKAIGEYADIRFSCTAN